MIITAITVHGNTKEELLANLNEAMRNAIQSVEMHGERANETGEGYQFDTCIVSDSTKAHLVHVAAVKEMDALK